MSEALTALGGSPPAPRRVGRWITILVLIAIAAILGWRGYDYYLTGLSARAEHPDYRLLNPAGFLGHGYGIVGTAMIFTNLLYLVRRRFTSVIPEWMGSTKAWLNAHAFTGLVGSLLVVFHSAFQLRTHIAAVTSGSLAIVVITGLIGFYLYALVPKAGLRPLKDRLSELQPLLPGVVAGVEDFVKTAPVTSLPHDASFVRTIFTIPRWVLQARRRRNGILRAAWGDKVFRVLARTEPALAKAFVLELGDLAAKEVDTEVAAAVMRSWRSLHRFLALLMLVSVSVHIAVAWFYGFRWIFD